MPAGTKKKPAQDLLCPQFESAFRILGKRWAGLILTSLADGPKRFCQLRDSVEGLSDRMLSIRLAEFEEEGLVDRGVDVAQRPVKVVYELTPRAQELRPALIELKSWAVRWMPESGTEA